MGYKKKIIYYIYNNSDQIKINNLIDDFIINKNITNNLEIKRKYKTKHIEKNKIEFNKIYIISFYYIILNIILFSHFIKCYNRNIIFASSYIKLKTNGTGDINIFSQYFPKGNYPNIIIINDKINYTNDKITYKYNFENNINNITLIWNKPQTTANNLFRSCYNIFEIDLSNFDTSQVINMESMFSDCSSLYSLRLSNFNTSKVNNMKSMFSGCSKLTSLDLSNFNTSKVTSMEFMFSRCSSLYSL